jgi:hypothetical protein
VVIGRSHCGFSPREAPARGQLCRLRGEKDSPRTVDSSDLRRWRMASQALETADPDSKRVFEDSRLRNYFRYDSLYKNTLSDRVNNFPDLSPYSLRLDDPLFLGLSIAGLIYCGLHATAWGAPFPTTAQRQIQRLSSVTLMASGPVLYAVGVGSRIFRTIAPVAFGRASDWESTSSFRSDNSGPGE